MSQLKKRSRKKTQGIVFGRYRFGRLISSPTDAEGHIAVFGGPGLGKTTALLVPTLRTWQGTSLTVDISGDICKNIDKPNKMVFEPENPNSTPYNIFDAIDELEDEDEQNEVLEQLALQLLPDAVKSSSDATEFFTAEGRKILTASLIAFYHKGFDFTRICEMIVDHDYESLFERIKNTENPNAIRFITSFAGTNEKNTAGCKQAVDKVLQLFATNEKIKKTIRRPNENESSFTPKALEKHNVFVIIDDAKLKLYSPVLHVITSQCMEFFSMRENYKKPTILFALDEFASFGKMEITESLRKLRKKGVRIMTLTQSMADMDLIYGKDERMSMMNNFRFKVVFGADDSDTQEYFAKLIGHKSVTKHSKSISDHLKERFGSVLTPETMKATKEMILQPDDEFAPKITDLTGIEHFTALEKLDCSINQLTKLDLSQNPNLKSLSCSYNHLTALDVSNNPHLTELDCACNHLESLNVGKNASLTPLSCGGNKLKNINVSQNKSLIYLHCSDNMLESLDVSNNPHLTDLLCHQNRISSLDVSNNKALKTLACNHNELGQLDLTHNADLHYEKNQWIDKYLPEIDSFHRIFCPCGEPKANYIPFGIEDTDILLDDYTKNLLDWKEQGGIGVKLLNGINHTQGTWQEFCVDYQDNISFALQDAITVASIKQEHNKANGIIEINRMNFSDDLFRTYQKRN